MPTTIPSLNAIGTSPFQRCAATIDRICLSMGRAPGYAPQLALGVQGEEAALFSLIFLGSAM